MRPMATAALALALALPIPAARTARADPQAPAKERTPVVLPAEERVLANGLKVIVLPDRSIPNVAMNTFWRVGSRNERTGITGVAHFFEHMMFRGGVKYGKSFDRDMEAAGGSNNAYTSFDVTVYQNWFPKSALPLVLDMERDRMSGLRFDPADVKAELEVVYSEFRLGREDPHEVLAEQHRAASYTAHPYQWDVIGWENDIRNWKQEDLERFYDENYAPNNAVMVIVGDVDPAETFRRVEDALGAIPRKPERRPVHTQEPPQKGERRVELVDPNAQLPMVILGWHMCATGDPEFPVFEVIEDLLLDGDASRLPRALVEEEQVCLGVGGGWQGHQFDPSLFTVDLTLRGDRAVEQAEERALALIAKLAVEGPTERELERVRNKNRAEILHRLAKIDGKAHLLGETETFFGGWRNVQQRIDRIAAVTADDVKRVVAKTFTKENRTVAVMRAGSGGEGGGHAGTGAK
ncbi:MAG: putative zinc protease [Planctomycetes bacterium]|nr:putative zinc protease [Planctomycetota bacterium]